MKYADFISLIKRQVAESAVGTSALRNQGASGFVGITREYFKKVDLGSYSKARNPENFNRFLDGDAEMLRLQFPIGAQNWGADRKAMNMFLRDATYNRYLFQEYGLDRIEMFLEVPIDHDVANGLITDVQRGTLLLAAGIDLPKWKSIKSLRPQENAAYQRVAQALAEATGIARVHVDLLYWRQSA